MDEMYLIYTIFNSWQDFLQVQYTIFPLIYDYSKKKKLDETKSMYIKKEKD